MGMVAGTDRITDPASLAYVACSRHKASSILSAMALTTTGGLPPWVVGMDTMQTEAVPWYYSSTTAVGGYAGRQRSQLWGCGASPVSCA